MHHGDTQADLILIFKWNCTLNGQKRSQFPRERLDPGKRSQPVCEVNPHPEDWLLAELLLKLQQKHSPEERQWFPLWADWRTSGKPTGGDSTFCWPPPPFQCGGRRRNWGSPPRQQTHIQREARQWRHAPRGGYNGGGARRPRRDERGREHHAEPARTEPEDTSELCHTVGHK